MNLAPFGAAAVVLVAWNVAGPLAPIQRLTFRSTTAIVTVDVSVKRGRVPVARLTAADFILTDNGVAQSVESLSLEAVPIDITLVIDLSNSVIDDVGAFKSDVQRFVKMLRPIDRVRVVSFASAVRENSPMQPASQPIDLRQLEAGGATSLNDGLLLAMLWPGELGRRHLVIAFTDGHDSMSTLANDVLPDLAERVDMVLHAVLVEWQGNMTSWMAGSRAALEEAVRRTGGVTHRQSRAAGDFKKIFDDFRASYVLQYMPRGVKREGWHEIAVRINRPDAGLYTVRARRGYMASDR